MNIDELLKLIDEYADMKVYEAGPGTKLSSFFRDSSQHIRYKIITNLVQLYIPNKEK